MSRRARWRRDAPPWWPEGEAWPPPRGSWRHVRRRFLLRAALVLVGGFLLFSFASAVLFHLVVADRETEGHWNGPPIGGFVILVVVAAVIVTRLLRNTAAPLGELMEASGRLAAGDYAVRVEERGGGDVRRAANAFNAMAERLEATEAQRRNLLADIAHELRTPLAIIRGNAEGLLDGVYQPDAAHAGLIIDEADVMARLLDDLRTLSNAEAGQLSLEFEACAPEDLAREAVAAFEVRAREAGVALDLEAGEALPEVSVDRVRLHQVLSNLLANALNHTPAGGAVHLEVSAAERGLVRFEVSDTGAGIPPDDLPNIFERFSRSPGSRGSGLGLAIAHSLVLAHGGEIHARSEVGHGTTIEFTLPAS